jgi:hypothetical protein
MAVRLDRALRRMAERIPIGIPSSSQMSEAPIPSVIDTGSRCAISSFTGMKFPYE